MAQALIHRRITGNQEIPTNPRNGLRQCKTQGFSILPMSHHFTLTCQSDIIDSLASLRNPIAIILSTLITVRCDDATPTAVLDEKRVGTCRQKTDSGCRRRVQDSFRRQTDPAGPQSLLFVQNVLEPHGTVVIGVLVWTELLHQQWFLAGVRRPPRPLALYHRFVRQASQEDRLASCDLHAA